MRTRFQVVTIAVMLGLYSWLNLAGLAAEGTPNRPPRITIAWPPSGSDFSVTLVIKIKAVASDDDGNVAAVRFYYDGRLIGSVTNPPFNTLWGVTGGTNNFYGYGWVTLRAVAVDNQGAETESAPVKVFYHSGAPPWPEVVITSPQNGSLIPEHASIPIEAEVMASLGDTGPIDYFVGTNLVGTVESLAWLSPVSAPSLLVVSNLLEGEYGLSVRYMGLNGCLSCLPQPSVSIRVVKLGVERPRLMADGRIAFDIVTSYLDKRIVVQSSQDGLEWKSVQTNYVSGSRVPFVDDSPPTESRRFFRAKLLQE